MLKKQTKNKIIDKSLLEIHQDLRDEITGLNNLSGSNKETVCIVKYNNIESNINLDWNNKEFNYNNLISISLIFVINIYFILRSSLISIIVSNLVSFSILYIMYLDGSLLQIIDCIFKEKLDNRYKKFLRESIPYYLNIIEENINNNKNISKEELIKIDMSNLEDKYIITCSKFNILSIIINRLVNNLIEECPTILNVVVDKSNADVIIKKRKTDNMESNIIIKKKGVVVDYKVDNGTYCIGSLEDDSIIVEVEELKDRYINIIDSKGLLIYVEN